MAQDSFLNLASLMPVELPPPITTTNNEEPFLNQQQNPPKKISSKPSRQDRKEITRKYCQDGAQYATSFPELCSLIAQHKLVIVPISQINQLVEANKNWMQQNTILENELKRMTYEFEQLKKQFYFRSSSNSTNTFNSSHLNYPNPGTMNSNSSQTMFYTTPPPATNANMTFPIPFSTPSASPTPSTFQMNTNPLVTSSLSPAELQKLQEQRRLNLSSSTTTKSIDTSSEESRRIVGRLPEDILNLIGLILPDQLQQIQEHQHQLFHDQQGTSQIQMATATTISSQQPQSSASAGSSNNEDQFASLFHPQQQSLPNLGEPFLSSPSSKNDFRVAEMDRDNSDRL